MGSRWCACGRGMVAKAREGLCADCWRDAQPQTVDGATIRELRENLSVNINEIAAAVGVDAKHFVDNIEGNMELDADYGRAIIAAIEALYDERQERPQAQQPAMAPAPIGSVAADLI